MIRHGAKTGIMWGRGTGHERLKEWTHRVRSYAQRSMAANRLEMAQDAPIAADVTFYLPRPKSAAKRTHCAVRPDLDKLFRGVFDPLIGVVIDEDSRIVSLSGRKVYADAENPAGAAIRIWTV